MTQEAKTTAITVAGGDALSTFLQETELAVDGTEEFEAGDVLIASKVFNSNRVDDAGNEVKKTAFYDTVTRTAVDEINAVFLDAFKTHEWSEFDQATKEQVTHCSSTDRKTGLQVLENGEKRERSCKGCSDFQWRTEDGKRTRRCGEVFTVAAQDRDTGAPFLIRFKRTSLPAWRQFYNRHIFGKLAQGNKRLSVPLFYYDVTLSLEMKTSGSTRYAVPTIVVTGELDLTNEDERALFLSRADGAKFARETLRPRLEQFMRADDGDLSESNEDTSFNYGANESEGDGDKDKF